MAALRRILFATDISDNARKAYPCQASLGKKFGVAVYLAHYARRRVPLFAVMSQEMYL